MGRLIVVSGTGTGIGKTHFTEALLLALGARGLRVAGLKPIETGFTDPEASDAARLERASSFHVKHTGIRFADPVSPHLAARNAGAPISVPALCDTILDVAPQTDLTVIELAGGLFSPLTETQTNADLVRHLRPDSLLLLAPDRLGVLHDLIAATRAAAAMHIRIDAVVLAAPEIPDTSTGRNANEVVRVLSLPLLATLARLPAPDLAHDPQMAAVVALLAGGCAAPTADPRTDSAS